MIQTKIGTFFSKVTSAVHTMIENTVLWNGFSIQEVLLEADSEFFMLEYMEFCMIEYLQVLFDELSGYF